MENTIYIGVGFVAAWLIFKWLHRGSIQDAEALFWSTQAEPLCFISEHPFDSEVNARAAEARNKIKNHGNRYISSADVWVYVYAATLIDGQGNEGISREFGLFREMAINDERRRREKWREEKTRNNPSAGQRIFANQNAN